MPAQSTATRGPNRALRAALAFGVVGLLWVAVPKLDAWQRRRFADRMARLAEASSAGAAQLAVRRLADSGLDAVDALVRLAVSTNADAAAAAQRAVTSQLATWEIELHATRDEYEFAQRLQALSAALASCEATAAPAGRSWMHRVALRIVDQCGRLSADYALGVLADCDRVLSSPLPVAPLPLRTTVVASPPIEADSTAAPLVAANPAPPPRTQETTAAPASDADVRVVDPHATEQESADAQPPTLDWQPAPAAESMAPVTPREANDAPLARPLPSPTPSESVIDVPSPLEARRLLRRYRQLSDSRLAAALAASSGYESLAIQQVLRERQLPSVASPTSTSPPAAGADAERQLFDRISRLPAPDARRLLRELADDVSEAPEMRLQALTLLATTGDPQLAEIARRRAIEDQDPRVAELASRILDDQAR